MHAVEARGLRFRYDDGTPALVDVDLSVRAGEMLALLAANGSGKTTLLKVLVGLLRPQQGQVHLWGHDIRRLAPRALHADVGLVLQNPRDQLFCATVEDDVAYGPRNRGWSETMVAARVDEALAAVGAQALRHRPVQHLSFGEQKRVAIAGVLAMQPRLLLVDEPTAGLDGRSEAHVLHLLRCLNATHRLTVVVATHAVDLLPVFADRLCVLRQGRVSLQGPLVDVLSDEKAIVAADLRLPYVAELMQRLRRDDGMAFEGFPLTIAEARQSLRELWARRRHTEDGAAASMTPSERP